MSTLAGTTGAGVENDASGVSNLVIFLLSFLSGRGKTRHFRFSNSTSDDMNDVRTKLSVLSS